MNFTSTISCLLITGLMTFSFFTDSYGQNNDDNREFDNRYVLAPGRPDSIFARLKKMNLAAVNAADLTLQGTTLRDMAEVCYHLGHYTKALQYYLDANKLFEKVKRDDLLADSYHKLGTLYYYNRDTANAKRSYDQSMLLFKALKNPQGIALTLGKLGHLQEKKQQYDSALIYQKKALEVYMAVDDKRGIARIYENMGSIYEDLSNYSSAMSYFRAALSNYQQAGETTLCIEVMNNIGDIYRKTGNYRQAMKQTAEALRQAKEKNELYQISSAYRDISKTYHLMGKNDSAYFYAETARSYLVKIYSEESSRQMAFLQALNDDEKKNDEIKALHNERRVNVIITIATVLIILLLIVAGFLLISRQRTQKRLMEAGLKNKEMEETQLKQEIELKSKELSTHVLHVIQKNHLLEGLKVQLEEMVKDDKRDQKKQLKHIINQINQDFNNDSYWSDFSKVFEQLHHSFFEHLNQQFPKLTSTDLRLVSLLKMNMDSNDMATMMAISQDSLRIARYRLRKKLNLARGENLVAFLQSI